MRWVPEKRVRFHPAAQDGRPCAVTDRADEVVAVQRVPLLADGSDRDRAAGKKSLGVQSRHLMGRIDGESFTL